MDKDIESLEQSLSIYRFRGGTIPAIAFGDGKSKIRLSGRMLWATVAAVALLLISIVVLSRFRETRRAPGYELTAVEGTPYVDGRPARLPFLPLGSTLTTGAHDRVRMKVGEMGLIELGSNSELTLDESSPKRQRLRLSFGDIRAQINAPAGVFAVRALDTNVIDLGCAYTLIVRGPSEGELRVSAGWVEVDRIVRQSLVPAGSFARFDTAGNISPPIPLETSEEFREAVLSWWTTRGQQRKSALRKALNGAKKPDALTLLNIMLDVDRADRGVVFDRLNDLVPAPVDVSRQAVVNGDRNAANPWWRVIEKELGLGAIKKVRAVAF